jgi:uncharacterized membrane protein
MFETPSAAFKTALGITKLRASPQDLCTLQKNRGLGKIFLEWVGKSMTMMRF